MNATRTSILPVRHEAVVFRPVSDGAVLLHTQDEVYYGLNTVGARIWELLPSSEDLDQLTSRLLQQYPEVDPETVRGDVVEILDVLRSNGLLVDP